MRVVAGTLGGQTFNAPKGHRSHPMSDKIRGALFNALGDVHGLTVLDAFAGSGALSIEAISRGADRAVAIEIDKDAHNTIENNLRQLQLANEVKAIRANCAGWSENNPSQLFDLVFCDPPYDKVQILQKTLAMMARHVKNGGIIVFSLPPLQTVELPEHGFSELSAKTYGDAKLIFYRRN